MSEIAVAPGKAPSMGMFERYLTLWVALCIVVGIALGQAVPGVFHALGTTTVAQINLPVAALVWLMVIPMLLKIDLAALGQVRDHWRGIAATVGINWLVKPFSMALLGWLFIGVLLRPYLPANMIDGYMAGLIPAGGRPLHRHGVRLVEPGGRRAALHAEPGGAQRRDHGGRLCAPGGAAARPVLHHRAMGHAAAVGRAVHRRALFGAAGYGLRTGLLAAPARILQGGAPLLFGLVLDRSGPVSALLLSGSLTAASFLAMLLLKAPSRSEAFQSS